MKPITAKVNEQYDLFVRNVSTACMQEVVKSFEETGDFTTTTPKRQNSNVDMEQPFKRSRQSKRLSKQQTKSKSANVDTEQPFKRSRQIKQTVVVSSPQHEVSPRTLTLIIT